MEQQEDQTSIQHINLEQDDRFDPIQQAEFQKYNLENQYDFSKHKNSHDITGTTGLVKAQNDELNIKKVQFRISNELYLRKHPELNDLIQIFLFKVLEEKPQNVISYAGEFFDRNGLE